jgi:hypothetical protein
LDGWKPIRRVLHFTTINVSTCKKFIDPWELLTDCLESLKSHREAMADKQIHTKMATGFRLSAAVVTRPRCVFVQVGPG